MPLSAINTHFSHELLKVQLVTLFIALAIKRQPTPLWTDCDFDITQTFAFAFLIISCKLKCRTRKSCVNARSIPSAPHNPPGSLRGVGGGTSRSGGGGVPPVLAGVTPVLCWGTPSLPQAGPMTGLGYSPQGPATRDHGVSPPPSSTDTRL